MVPLLRVKQGQKAAAFLKWQSNLNKGKDVLNMGQSVASCPS